MSNIVQTFPRGSGGSGHTILDGNGNSYAQEKNLKITGLSVTDNPGDESTDLAPAGLNQDSIDDIVGTAIPDTIFTSNELNYSTSEQIVGRWIDGKPIYRKFLPINSGTITQVYVDPYVDKFIDLRLYFHGNDQQEVANPCYANESFRGMGYYIESTKSLQLVYSAGLTMDYAFVQFTRTID